MTLDQLDYILASDLSRFALEEESSPSTFYILTLGLGSKSLTDFMNCMDDVIRHKTALIYLKILLTGEKLSTKKLEKERIGAANVDDQPKISRLYQRRHICQNRFT